MRDARCDLTAAERLDVHADSHKTAWRGKLREIAIVRRPSRSFRRSARRSDATCSTLAMPSPSTTRPQGRSQVEATPRKDQEGLHRAKQVAVKAAPLPQRDPPACKKRASALGAEPTPPHGRDPDPGEVWSRSSPGRPRHARPTSRNSTRARLGQSRE